MLPLVDCICPTYGRAPTHLHLIEEAIQSFMVQDYPADRRRLIIFNDCPCQTLTCSVYNVAVLNHPHRFASLGEKYNWAIHCGEADLIMPWEDDDISLPSRISQAVNMLGVCDYWNPQRTWFLDESQSNPGGPGLHSTHCHGVCHNASIFRRSAWRRAGEYPHISGAQDAVMDRALKSLGPMPRPLDGDTSTWQYIYRWGVSPTHLSGRWPHDDFYREVGTIPVASGTYELTPRWRRDYAAMASSAHLAIA